MTVTASLILMLAATFGGGALLLKGAGVLQEFSLTERLALSLVLGFGVMGWGVFFLAYSGMLGVPVLVSFLAVLATGIYFLKSDQSLFSSFPEIDIWGKILLAGLLVVLVFDTLEGLSPPGDADSLAYHFALPKSFLRVGQLFPVYRAADGAVPLLQQMTYMVALGVGGELTLTLWTMVSGWFVSAMVFVIAHRYMTLNYALVMTLVFMTTPAVVYGAGSGQNEVRNAMFVLVAALAVSEALKTGFLRYALLAGIAAGLFAASKYTGLIFAFSCGLMLMPQKKWFSHGLVFTAAFLASGGQWYAWNWLNTGDPVFPMLYGFIEYPETTPWNDTIQEVLQNTLNDKSLPANPIWFFLYPVYATLFAAQEFDNLRVGFGPAALLLLPMAGLGIWQFRKQIWRHPLMGFAGICLLTYGVWFFIGPSQRVRHLLPIYPLLLLCLMVSAVRVRQRFEYLSRPLCIMFVCILGIQFAGMSLYTIKYARYVLGNETRDAFLERNVVGYDTANAVNDMLTMDDHLLVMSRQLTYFFDIPVLYVNSHNQAVVETYPWVSNAKVLFNQLQEKNITHMLLPEQLSIVLPGEGFFGSVKELENAGCAKVIREFISDRWVSRTLPDIFRTPAPYSLIRFIPGNCQL